MSGMPQTFGKKSSIVKGLFSETKRRGMKKRTKLFLIMLAIWMFLLGLLITLKIIQEEESLPAARSMTTEILNAPDRRTGFDYILTRGDGWVHAVKRWSLLGITHTADIGYSTVPDGWWREIMRRTR
jgi:hypothetical protein